MYINIPREDSYLSLENGYILVEFEVTHNDIANTLYADNSDTCLVDLGPIAFFSKGRIINNFD